MSFSPGDIKMTQMGPMPEPGARSYSLGGVAVHESSTYGKWRFSGQADVENGSGRVCALGDPLGTGRLRILGQGVLSTGGGGGGGGRPGSSSGSGSGLLD